MQVTKTLIKSAIWALRRADTQCRHMHHGKTEQHAVFNVCPVEEKVDFVLAELTRALEEAKNGGK